MHADVLGWTQKCDRCALAKIKPHTLRTPIGRLMGTHPLEVVAMDFAMLEPSSDGRHNVLVITDVLSKFTIAVPTRNQKAETVANVLVNEWFTRYGVPQRLHSDNGGICSLPSYTSWRRYTTSSVRIPHHTIQLGTDNASVSTGLYTTCCGHRVPQRSDDGLTISRKLYTRII